ncbi:serine-type D-Ala-D-Ala carboxypeptidase [Lacticaseibacillus brantae DSM 23927]|uniref:Serine-type D-Ala-D-Ala carboxypeptidase n=1 Tax=Lacticaseibacillus brantae DSM 23927 TaxID=1423727 RepID=A0A0R2B577_9LACO|nr:serine-type D-Ala-D-Ala carboxypeptidase [Lacticaseibacillus brantae DSM 23927]
MVIGLLLGVVVSFAGYKLIISPRNAQQAEQQQRRYEAMLTSQRAEDQRLLNQGAQKLKSNNSAFTKTALSTAENDHAQEMLNQLTQNHYLGTVLVVKNGQVILNQGVGDADAIAGRKNGPNTLFQIGSVQKSVTAALIMKLVDEGKLKLSDPIGKYLSGIKTGNKVTIRMMLNMRSGLAMNTKQDKTLSDRAIVDYAISHLVYVPEGKQNYQPVNYVLLAGVIEKVTGNLYSTEVQNEIVRPLKLIHTGFMPGLLKESNRAIGYSGPVNNPYVSQVKWPDVMWNRELGTGNIYATAGDLFQMEQGIVQGRVASMSAITESRNLTNGEYAGGVYNFGNYFLTHGILGGHEATVVMRHDGNTGVVLLGNHYTNTIPGKPIAMAIYRLLVDGAL